MIVIFIIEKSAERFAILLEELRGDHAAVVGQVAGLTREAATAIRRHHERSDMMDRKGRS